MTDRYKDIIVQIDEIKLDIKEINIILEQQKKKKGGKGEKK